MNGKIISKFIDFVCDGHVRNANIFWELRFIRKDGKVEQHWFNDPEDIKKFLLSHKTYSWNSYIGINPRFRKQGDDDSVRDSNILAIDIDSPAAVDKADEIYQRLAEKNLRPSLVVASGSGIHVYYKLKEIIAVTGWKDLQDRLISFFQKEFPDLKIDPTIRNPSRVMRVIGSLNVKYGKPLETYFLIEDYSEYAVEDIVHALPIVTSVNGIEKKHMSAKVKFGKIRWIENLHKTPISDGRHRVIDLILIPYAKNILKLDSKSTINWIMDWVSRSNKLNPTNIDERYIKQKFERCPVAA